MPTIQKTGILLLNLGGPWTTKDVKPFLYRLFADPAILQGIPAPFRQGMALFISTVKGPSSIRSYEAIGGGSPQLKWSQVQAEGLESLLNASATGQPGSAGRSDARHSFKVALGMRASSPEIMDALKSLRDWGAERLVLFPLFPQYSTTTTGSCFKEARRCLEKLSLEKAGWNPEVKEIRNWPDHRDYSGLIRKTLEEALDRQAQATGFPRERIYVLLSAHSLPMSTVKRGDPYPEDVNRTVAAVTQGLKNPWSLAFQSRNGPLPWLTPYTESELERLGEEGIKHLIVVPISFVSDHIETLWELDQLYADLAKKSGITHYDRARSFNGDPAFQRALAQVFRDALPEIRA